MAISWENSSPTIKKFMEELCIQITKVCHEDIVGIYLHGSLAMGCFNPNQSDVDVLVITNKPIALGTKRQLAQVLLTLSTSPYPIEISFLNKEQLQNWQHPCPFDFHYSEYWRKRYEDDLQSGTAEYINDAILVDVDLAAHITIVNSRGVCLEGKPIPEVFPSIPKADYLSSIKSDFEDCLENIIDNPIYCILNMLRVLWYVKEGTISSKLEAGEWGVESLPNNFETMIRTVINQYIGKTEGNRFSVKELLLFKNLIVDEIGRTNAV